MIQSTKVALLVFPAWVPYELIGKAVVAIFAIAATIVALGAMLFGLLFVWIRGWAFVSNSMWRGVDPTADETPPSWKLRVSGVALALSRFEFRKIPEAYRRADEMAGSQQSFMQYLKEVFVENGG